MSNQVQNQPSAAYWLSIIGSIIGILASIGFFALGATAYALVSQYEGFYGYYDASAIGWGFTFYFALGAWCLISSILVFIFARKLKANPLAHGKYGLLILIFSIIGLGTILGFIGGILAITYKPIPVGAPQQYAPQQPYYGPPPQQAVYQQPMATTCPQCGTQVQPGVRFCPNCGRQLN
jgi:hypothetical protein